LGVPRPDSERGVYGISVAAELVGTGVQNLRLYEARGLLEPERTDGGTRRYSSEDLNRLRRIGDLLEAGLNLAGIALVLDLEAQNTELRAEKEEQPVAPDRIDPSEQIPEADLLEQHAPLDPDSLTDPDSRTDVEPVSAIPEAGGDAVDEADRLEQHAPVFGDDDDYQHEPAGGGWW